MEGVDKSIGEDTDRSSQGSYETKRKYYILNIDNTANEEAPVVSLDSKVDQQSSSLPQQTTLDRDQTTPLECNAGSKQNSIMSKQNAKAASTQEQVPYTRKAGDLEAEFFTDR